MLARISPAAEWKDQNRIGDRKVNKAISIVIAISGWHMATIELKSIGGQLMELPLNKVECGLYPIDPFPALLIPHSLSCQRFAVAENKLPCSDADTLLIPFLSSELAFAK